MVGDEGLEPPTLSV